MNSRLALISLYNINTLGVRYLTSYLRHKNINVSVIFFKNMFANDAEAATKKEKELLIDILKKINPQIIGISVSCSALLKIATTITGDIHNQFAAPVIWGGVHPTIMPEESIKVADFVCAGDGEKPLLRLIESLNNPSKNILNLPNIWIRQNGKITSNDTEPVDDSFCALPFPDYSSKDKFFIDNDLVKEDEPFKEEPWVYNIMASKGCKYLCTYCCNDYFMKASGGKKVYIRKRSAENVIEELKKIKKDIPGIKMIQFADDEFANDAEWIIDFCKLYRKEVGLPFWCCYHPLGINEHTVKHLRSAGLERVLLGVQSGSRRVRKKIFHRPESDKVILKAVALLNKHNVIPKIDLIFDNPFETEEDKNDALNFFLELPPPVDFHLFSLLYFPKTRLTEMALKEKIISKENIEGESEKSLSAMVATPNHKRSNAESFWICIISLTGKSFVPKFMIRFLYRSNWLRKKPGLLFCLAYIANLIRLGQVGITAAFKGQLTFSFVKKYIGHFARSGA